MAPASQPSSAASPGRFIPPGDGAQPVHVPAEALAHAAHCALCGSDDRVLQEHVPAAADLEKEQGMLLPFCADCARRQRQAMGRAWWLGPLAAVLPLLLATGLFAAVPTPFVAAMAGVIGLVFAAYRVLMPWARHLRERAVPVVVVKERLIQVPARRGTGLDKAALHPEISVGFYLALVFVLLAAPFIWEASMPPLLIDNPTNESCTLIVDGVSRPLPPTREPEKERLHASRHVIEMRCSGLTTVTQVFDGRWGRATLISADPEACYSSQRVANTKHATYAYTSSHKGTVQFPESAQVGRTTCSKRPWFW